MRGFSPWLREKERMIGLTPSPSVTGGVASMGGPAPVCVLLFPCCSCAAQGRRGRWLKSGKPRDCLQARAGLFEKPVLDWGDGRWMTFGNCAPGESPAALTSLDVCIP